MADQSPRKRPGIAKLGTGVKAKRRRKPAALPRVSYPCRIFFWQPIEGGPIRIGHVDEGDDRALKMMWALGDGKGGAHRLGVLSRVDAESEATILGRFAHLMEEAEGQAGTPAYRPAPELLEFIGSEAVEWQPPVGKPRRRSEPDSAVPVRTCARCAVPFETNDNDLMCKDCQKAELKKLEEEGFLTKVPWHNPFGSRPEYGRGDSPSFENVIRAIEGD